MARPPAKMNHAEDALSLVVASADIVLTRGGELHQVLRTATTSSQCRRIEQAMPIVQFNTVHVRSVAHFARAGYNHSHVTQSLSVSFGSCHRQLEHGKMLSMRFKIIVHAGSVKRKLLTSVCPFRVTKVSAQGMPYGASAGSGDWLNVQKSVVTWVHSPANSTPSLGGD